MLGTGALLVSSLQSHHPAPPEVHRQAVIALERIDGPRSSLVIPDELPDVMSDTIGFIFL